MEAFIVRYRRVFSSRLYMRIYKLCLTIQVFMLIFASVMNENIYFLDDNQILFRCGERIKQWRLKQNVSQSALASRAGISLSSVQKVERGEPVSIAVFMKVLRHLRKLEIFSVFLEEERLTPSEYFRMQEKVKIRRRASKS